MIVTPNLPKGMRDFLPQDVLARERVLQIIKEAFERFGFSPLATPSIERIEILTGKAGEESDTLTFKILKRGEGESSGEVDLGLRYDLTVPLARVIAMHPEVTLPFKRYQMERVWRAERPQRGRYREFLQCDADIVGSSSLYADAEIVALTDYILGQLGFSAYKIHINHRLLIDTSIEMAGIPAALANMSCVVIDKMDKIGRDGVKDELLAKGIKLQSMKKLMSLLDIDGNNEERFKLMEKHLHGNAIGIGALNEMREIYKIITEMDVPATRILYDPFLIRGMGYYTGPVFESFMEEPRIGSLTGGGRYDNLIGIFKGEKIPATGTTIGFDRIIDVMRALDILPQQRTCTHVLVTIFNQELAKESLTLTTELRKAGLACELYLVPGDKLAKQLRYADEHGIRLALILGPDELANGTAVLRDLESREQYMVVRSDLYWQIAEILNL